MKAAKLKCKIISNRKIAQNYWHLVFESGFLARHSKPGQFIHIRVDQADEPLLRRPISIHKAENSKITLIYEVLGKATQGLAKKKKGELLDLIGPLGNGFTQIPELSKGKSILVAGGMGVAPLLFLAERIKRNKPWVLLGARSKPQIICDKEFKALGCRLQLATEDGSGGYKGKVTDLLLEVLSTIDYRLSTIFACGPRPMLKAIRLIAEEKKINTQLSLEEHMACGIGACLGCVVKTKAGYKRVCQDGPVFQGKDLIW